MNVMCVLLYCRAYTRPGFKEAGTRTSRKSWGKETALQVPARFEYEVAGSVEEAIELLQRHGPEAYLMAGGHSLLPMMKLRLASPEVVIAIHKLDGELRYIGDDGGVLRIGALARH